VRALNGTDKTYSITVTQPAPAAKPAQPTVAPDLIAEDDSCQLDQADEDKDGITDECFVVTVPGVTNSREDNITNVKRPRFTIPPPATGETPNLYVGTTKYTFPPGTTTLTPLADLSEGDNTITYTLTNSGGESDPSPSLNVIINATAPVQ
jgi:hypothetical protein